jgi:hypothetical protein
MTTLRDIYMSMYKKPEEIVSEDIQEIVEPNLMVEEVKLDESKEDSKIEKELETIVAKIDKEDSKKVEESVAKNHSVWSKDEKGNWSHYSDYDNSEDAKDDKSYLKRQGEKCVKVIKTDKDKSDWRKDDHREAAIKQLNEDVSSDNVLDLIKSIISVWKQSGNDWTHHQDYDDEDSACEACSALQDEDDIDDARVVKTNQDQSDWSNPENTHVVILGLGGNIQEGTDRSEYSANLNMVGKPTTPTKGKFTLRDKDGNVLSGTEEHDDVDSATKAWKNLTDKKGIKIVKESTNGPIDIMTEEALMEAFDVNAVGDVTNDAVLNLYGRNYNTKAFKTIDDANAFMSSEDGKEHGYLGQCPNGLYHCAHNNDSGVEAGADEE